MDTVKSAVRWWTMTETQFGKSLLPYSGLFLAYALGALLMGLSEKLAVMVFGASFIGSIVGGLTAARSVEE